MNKIKVLLLYIVYPLAMATYFKKALEHRDDVDLKVAGIYTGNWIPWNGAARARKYVKTEKGKESRRATMRKVWAKRRGCYIKFDLSDEKRIYTLCNESCAYCKIPIGFDELEFDHFIPVKLGGKTEPSNMLPSCSTCNRGKGGKRDKEPHTWLVQRFGQILGEKIYNDCVSILQAIKEKNV